MGLLRLAKRLPCLIWHSERAKLHPRIPPARARAFWKWPLFPRSVICDGYRPCGKVLTPASGIAARGDAMRAVLSFATRAALPLVSSIRVAMTLASTNRAVLIGEVQGYEGWPSARVAIGLGAREVQADDGGRRKLVASRRISEGSGLVDRDQVDGAGILVNAAGEPDGPCVRVGVGHYAEGAYVLVMELKRDKVAVDLRRAVDSAYDRTRQ